MVLERWPTVGELGASYYNTWRRMATVYYWLVLNHGEEEWLMALEDLAFEFSVEADGIRDMRCFIESFIAALPYFNFDVYWQTRPLFTHF